MDQTPQVLRCTHCGEFKPPEAFHVNRRLKRGRLQWCKPCHLARRAELYALGRIKGEVANHFRTVGPVPDACLHALAKQLRGLREQAIPCAECGNTFAAKLFPGAHTAGLFCPDCIRRRVLAVKAERRPKPNPPSGR